ncbi:hypothetical protein [Afipia birgiae]|uniref:hypothetical protein n=1 Tax=Afipia birgiae TaxID=151414 RepID=UPI0005907CA0|nr:hypothetical protein [Afipia birgiae]MBX9820004.1 hypothetical protein [Afipia birgiae]
MPTTLREHLTVVAGAQEEGEEIQSQESRASERNTSADGAEEFLLAFVQSPRTRKAGCNAGLFFGGYHNHPACATLMHSAATLLRRGRVGHLTGADL